MDSKTVFVVTLRGAGEAKNHTSLLSGDIKRALALIDDKSTVAELTKRAAPSLRAMLEGMLQELLDGGFIEDKARKGQATAPRIATPKMAVPTKKIEDDGEELDFTSFSAAPARPSAADDAAKLKAQQDAEAARVKAQQEAAAAAKAKAEAEARAVAEAKAKQEFQAKQELEAARLKAQQEAAAVKAQLEAAKAKAEAEAKARVEAEARAKQEMEAARLKAQQEAEAVRTQLEAAKAKAEAEAKTRAEAEARAAQEAEAARRKLEEEAARVRAEAEAARIKAEQEAARAKAEIEAARMETERVRAELEAARVRAEAEAVRIKAEQEMARIKAEQEMARIKAEEDARAQVHREVEAIKRKAEEEALRAKAEQEAARIKAEEARAQAIREAEEIKRQAEQEATRAKIAREQQAEQEAARVKAEQEAKAQAMREAEAEAAQARAEAEAGRQQAALEAARLQEEVEAAKARAETLSSTQRLQAEEEIARAEVEAKAAKVKAEAVSSRTMIATVLFFDVVGYTKQSVSKQIELKAQFNGLVSEFIKDIEENLRIILDTGDGAAIGFLQHPEHAMEVALQFRQAVTANKHQDYPELKVRMGIHLGPVNVVKDMNGQSNMVGDGINDAQRIMSFAAADQIFISRAYYDVASRLSSGYAKLFQYHGTESDKHGRQHQVYEVKDEKAEEQPQISQEQETPFNLQLDAFSLPASTAAEPVKPAAKGEEKWDPEATAPSVPRAPNLSIAPEGEDLNKSAEAAEKARQAELLRQQEAEALAVAARQKAEQEAARLKEEAAARKVAEEQSKIWASAEQRAKEQAVAAQAAAAAEPAPAAAKVKQTRSARPRQPLPLGKITGGLVVLALLLAYVLPMVWPMQEYVAQVEKKLSAQLQQPVHIAGMKVALLPLPQLELQDVSIGGAQELKAGNVVLDFSLGALFSDTRSIRQVSINDVAVQAESLGQILSWLQAAGSDVHYPLAHMEFQGLHVNGEGLNLPALQGTADWDGSRPGKAAFRSEDDKLNVELQAQQTGWLATLRMKNSSLPMLLGVLFNEFNAKGTLDTTGANFTELDGGLYGGLFTGNARATWQKGWQIQGHLNLKLFELEAAFAQYGVTGVVEGDANFMMSAATFAQLGSAPRLDGNFVVRKGTLNKIDIVEVAGAARQGAGGARTYFDELSGVVQLDSNVLHFRQIKISAGVMNATGAFDVGTTRDLSGRLAVDLKMRAGQGSIPLQLSGTLAQPVLRVGH